MANLYTNPDDLELCVARDEQQLHGWRRLQQHGQQQYGQHAEPQLHSFLSVPPTSQHLKAVQAQYDERLSETMGIPAIPILSSGHSLETVLKREIWKGGMAH